MTSIHRKRRVPKTGKVLVTSAWPYVNVTPHLGNLIGSILSADVYARYCRLKGEETLLVSGSDEHGTPIEVEAFKEGIPPKQLADKNHAQLVGLLNAWEISFDNFTRTENPLHIEFTKQFLKRVYENGYITAQDSDQLYCEHDGRFLPDRFVEGRCPYCGYQPARGDQCENCGRLLEPTLLVEPHCVICGQTPVVKMTKHWYFDLPKLADRLTEFLKSNKQLSASTRNFSLSLLKEGLKPRAVTRDVSRTSRWGIPAPFPGAENKTVYVWVEAVLGYISATIEYFQCKGEPEKWKEYWLQPQTKSLYFIGKDNILFHTIILPALLIASGENYNLPWNVAATEWLQFKGEKASKSQRKGIFIDEALELFPADYWRFFLLSSRPETKDTNFSWDLFKEKINADLNDTYGNFIHRTLSFISTQFGGQVPQPSRLDEKAERLLSDIKEKTAIVGKNIEECRYQSAMNALIDLARAGNQYLNSKEPWNLIKKNKEEAGTILYVAAQVVRALAILSAPFVPLASEHLWKNLNISGSVHEQDWSKASESLPEGHEISLPQPLFRKIEENEKQLEERLAKVRQKILAF